MAPGEKEGEKNTTHPSFAQSEQEGGGGEKMKLEGIKVDEDRTKENYITPRKSRGECF